MKSQEKRNNLSSPVTKDFQIHKGEDFCDEMYLHSYRSRKFHTAEDYILRWKEKSIQSPEISEQDLIKQHKDIFQYIPDSAEFWKDPSKRVEFLKINLYRAGVNTIDTNLGLYPRTKDDVHYGYGEKAFAVYDGIVIESVSPEKPKGWGKAILIEHKAPKGFVFEIENKGNLLSLEKFWTQYSHNLKNLVKTGDTVKQNQAVVLIGDGNGIFNTLTGVEGIREGAHLHFEIRIKKYKLFPDNDILTNREKLEEIYMKPSYFLENVRLRKVEAGK